MIEILLATIPVYLVRFQIGFLRTNLYEVIVGVILLYTAFQFREELIKQTWKFIRQYWYLEILLGLAVLGVVVSNQTVSSLGVLKSYFLVPFAVIWILEMWSTKSDSLPKIIRGLSFAGLAVAIPTLLQGLGSLVGAWQGRPTAIYAIGVDPNLSTGGFANYIGMFLVPIIFILLEPLIEPLIEPLKKNTLLRCSLRHSMPYLLVRLTRVLARALHCTFFQRFSVVAGRVQFGYYIVLGILIFATIFSQSYTALITLGMVGTLKILFDIKNHKKSINKKSFLSGLLILVIILGVFGAGQVRTEKFQNLFDMSKRNSISSRIQIWHTSSEILKENWLFGIGLSDFQKEYEKVVPNLYFPPHEWLVPEPHNMFLAFWLHLGVGGLVWILALPFYLWSQVKKRPPEVFWVGRWSIMSIYVYGLLDTSFWKNDLSVVFFVSVWWVMTNTNRYIEIVNKKRGIFG